MIHIPVELKIRNTIFQRLPEKIQEKDEKLKAEMLGKKNIQFVIVLLSVLMYLWVFPINKAA